MSTHDSRTAALREPSTDRVLTVDHVLAYKRALREIGRPATHEEIVARLGYDLEGLGLKALLTSAGGWIECSPFSWSEPMRFRLPSSTVAA